MRKKITHSPLLGRRLYQARMAAGLTQEQVAQRLLVDRTTYTKYENGTVDPPLQMAYQISQIFNVTLDELLKPE